MKQRAMWLALCAVAILEACGGNGSDRPRIVRDNLDGLLLGTLTVGDQTHILRAAVRDERILAIDATANVLFDAPLTVVDGAVSSSALRVYAEAVPGRAVMRGFSEVGSLQATVSPTYVWSGTITTSAGSATLVLRYDEDAYAQDSAATFVAGTWKLRGAENLLTIDATGAASTALAADCPATGTVGVVDPDHNLYAAELTATGTGCGVMAGTYTGVVTLGTTAAPLDTLALLAFKPELSLNALWDRQP
jgi:hypothetical protein